MNDSSLISWSAPEHIHTDRSADWYWSFGIITVALAIVCVIFGQIVPAIFVVVAATGLAIHAAHPPKIVEYKITQTGGSARGNTAGSAQKDAILENGLRVKVPLFINNGEVIRVDTRTGTYVERAK